MRTAGHSALLLLVGCFGFSGRALGSECNSPGSIEDTFKAEIESAALVFVGIATSRSDLDLGRYDQAARLAMSGDEQLHWFDTVQVEFVVSRVWKGEPVDRVFVRTMPGEGRTFGVGSVIGQEYIIFAFRNPYDEALHMHSCSLSSRIPVQPRVLGLLADWSRTAR
jgi:hypothetical protein